MNTQQITHRIGSQTHTAIYPRTGTIHSAKWTF